MKTHQVRFLNLANPLNAHGTIKKQWTKGSREISNTDYETEVEMCYEDGNYDDVEYEKTPERQEIRKFYQELQRFKKLKKVLEEHHIDPYNANGFINLMPEPVANIYYEYEAADIFKIEGDLEQVIKSFRPDPRFDVLLEGCVGFGDGSDFDYNTKLKSNNLEILYHYEHHLLGSQTHKELKITNKKTGHSLNLTDNLSQSEIEKTIIYINQNA